MLCQAPLQGNKTATVVVTSCVSVPASTEISSTQGYKVPDIKKRVAWSSPSTLSVVRKGFYGVHDQGDLSFGVRSITMCQAGSPIT